MRFQPFSRKQMQAMTWWCGSSAQRDREGLICDGAVRSGKSLCLSLSFVAWSMAEFEGQTFALCGKTVGSLRRNVVLPLLPVLEELGFGCKHKISQSLLEVERKGRKNRYYLFGGRDEGSAAYIQGITLAGILFDEVALMPRSFVEQGLARCSVEGSRFWFNCNPDTPAHWFYREWVVKAEKKNVLYLHFTMEDNPALSPEIRERYRSLYSGVFYQRYVLGRWVQAQGLVYPAFHAQKHVVEEVPSCSRYLISCDYGIVNPASFGLWGEQDGVWYRVREHYHDSRKVGYMKTDEEYADALEELAGEALPEAVVVDPSAASFIQCLRKRGRFSVIAAGNSVQEGIRLVGAALQGERLRFHKSCRDTIWEFEHYHWKSGAQSDTPCKEHDHAMDDIRYFCTYVFGEKESAGFYALSARRAR